MLMSFSRETRKPPFFSSCCSLQRQPEKERKSSTIKEAEEKMSRLAPLSEEPINEDYSMNNSTKAKTWRKWLQTRFPLLFLSKKSDLKTLLSVLGCPLFPLPVITSQQHVAQVSSSAEYIIQHFRAATGCRKLEGMVKNVYATGKVAMTMVDHAQLGLDGSAVVSSNSDHLQKGCFVMWQMVPNKWLIELAVEGHKVVAGSDGDLAWRHTPWLGGHAAKGGARPLRRAFQGLDLLAISAVFSQAEYMGEKKVLGMDCFVLKLSATHVDLSERSDSTAEMIKHAIFGYFSQRSGLLVFLEDSYLTRVQSPGSQPTYWETSMATKIEDYRLVEGVKVAHSGQTSVMITRFGDNVKLGPNITRMEETWTIDDVAFNVPGLSLDCFISPKELPNAYPEENLEWRSPFLQ